MTRRLTEEELAETAHKYDLDAYRMYAKKAFRTFQMLEEGGKLPERSRLRIYGDGSGAILKTEVVERGLELDGEKAVLVREYELGVIAQGNVWLEQEPYPYRVYLKRVRVEHPSLRNPLDCPRGHAQ